MASEQRSVSPEAHDSVRLSPPPSQRARRRPVSQHTGRRPAPGTGTGSGPAGPDAQFDAESPNFRCALARAESLSRAETAWGASPVQRVKSTDPPESWTSAASERVAFSPESRSTESPPSGSARPLPQQQRLRARANPDE